MAGVSRRAGTVGVSRPPAVPQDRYGYPGAGPVLLDCGSCAVRGVGCSDCVVALLLGPPDTVVVDGGQVEALAVLAGSGLVPPLRHTGVERGA